MSYDVSNRCSACFSHMQSLDCVKKAMKFVEDDQGRTMEELKELVLI